MRSCILYIHLYDSCLVRSSSYNYVRMSLKNYIFATINTKSTTTFQSRGEDQAVDTTIPTIIEGDSSESSMNWLKKAWRFVSIEPVMICWILPSCLLYIAIENLSLEKVGDLKLIKFHCNFSTTTNKKTNF